MGTIVGEIRAGLGLLATIFSLRRRRRLVQERRWQLESVLHEAMANLDGLRRLWNVEHQRFNWRGWLHLELLSTRVWHERKRDLTTRLDYGLILNQELSGELDSLYGELDRASRGSHSFSSDWEPRLLDLVNRLNETTQAYPTQFVNRLVSVGLARISPLEIDQRIRTPSSPAAIQQRLIHGLRRAADESSGAAE